MRFIEHIEGLFGDKLNIFKDFFALFKLEAKLAKLNIFPFILNLLICLVLFIAALFLGLGLLAYLLVNLLKLNTLMTLALLFLTLCILLASSIGLLLAKIRKMSFPQTRACFLQTTTKDTSNE